MITQLDSTFTKVDPAPFASDRPLLPRKFIAAELAKREKLLTDSQYDVLESETEALLQKADPILKKQDFKTGFKSIVDLTWNANITLQRPIYGIWDRGYLLGGQHMQAAIKAAVPSSDRAKFAVNSGTPEKFALPLDVARLLSHFLNLDAGQIMASAAQAAVVNRVIQLASRFSTSQMVALKSHLIAAITPQVDTGDPISRKDLLKRIEKTLNVGRNRAETIARTELTNAYNVGRVDMARKSTLVEAFRFIPIEDTRTTDICRSRQGLIIPADDTLLLNANTPALHYRCRSTLSPVLPRVNAQHQQFMKDPSRRAQNRALVPLLEGWS